MRRIETPHHSLRGSYRPEAIVIHTFAGSMAGTEAWIRNSDSRVSYHYGVGLDGEYVMFVEPHRAAWHAGKASPDAPAGILARYPGENPNRYTIGVGHEGDGVAAWPAVQYDASVRLVAALCVVHGIHPDVGTVVPHRSIRTDKACPGPWLFERWTEYVFEVADAAGSKARETRG